MITRNELHQLIDRVPDFRFEVVKKFLTFIVKSGLDDLVPYKQKQENNKKWE